MSYIFYGSWKGHSAHFYFYTGSLGIRWKLKAYQTIKWTILKIFKEPKQLPSKVIGWDNVINNNKSHAFLQNIIKKASLIPAITYVRFL